MSFLLWHRDRNVRIASSRLVLRAAEVPVFADANQLCDRLEQLRDDEVRYVAAAGDEARAQGQAAGYEEGRRQARDELAAIVAQLRQEAAAETARLRDDVAALALQVVRKIAGQVAPDDVLVALASTAARDMLPAPVLTLVVHPQRCDAVRERLATAAGDVAALRFEVRGDAACDFDTCLIETEHGSVDASLDAQLERLARAWGADAARRGVAG